MGQQTNRFRLDTTTCVHVGAYLVCHLQDFYDRISPYGIGPSKEVAERLRKLLGELSPETPSLQCSATIQAADQLLEELDILLTRVRPAKQKEFLLPLFKGASKFLRLTKSHDSKLYDFLKILCEDHSRPWMTTLGFCHDARGELNKLVGHLMALSDSLTESSAPPERLKVLQKVVASLDILDNEYYTYMHHEFRIAGEEIISAFFFTEYVKPAIQMMAARVLQHIESDSLLETKRNYFYSAYKNIIEGEWRPFPAIHLIWLLREVVGWVKAEEVLIEDKIISELKQRITID